MTDVDGAQDKLFHEDSANSLKDHVEVKFVSPDNAKNGDAKINIGDLKSSFAGMGKEELMKFANDPFWVRLRWCLFVCFWLIWCGMLIGAIAIIVYAPKCDANSGQKYTKSPLYEVDVKSFKDGDDKQDGFGDLKGLSSKVDYLKSLGIKQISLASILKSNPEDVKGSEVVNFTEIHPTYGSMDDFKDLVAKLKAADIHLLLSFSPDCSSTKHEFFKKSVQKEEPYTNYYVWASASGYGTDGTPLPPNNWLSKEGGSAWEWNAERKEFYLHQFGKNQPEFNMNNPAVVQYFNDVLKFWLEQGVSGFKLENIEYLLEDPDLRNETISNKPGFTHDQYEFYNHQHTTQTPGIGKILDIWGTTVHNYTGGVLIVSDSLTEKSPQVNLVAHKLEVTSTLTATQLKVMVDKWNKENKISWQWSCSDGTLKCVPPSLLDVLNIVAFLLPGTPISRSGEELGLVAPQLMPWNSQPYGGFTSGQTSWASTVPDFSLVNAEVQAKDPLSHFSLYQQLVALRESPAVQSGTLQSSVYNDTVFAFTRVKSDKSGVLVAVNLDPAKQKTVDLSSHLSGVPAEVKVVLTSKPVSDTYAPNSTIPSTAIQLPPYSGAVFTFAPHSAA